MTQVEIGNKILELFNKKREKANTKFDESHFLDYLTFPPKNKGQIKNSFKGVRKYYRFMDSLEIEFSICFTLSDLDNPYYSVEQLTKKVQERINKRKGNLIIIKQRIAEKDKYYFEFLLILILTTAFFIFKTYWIPLLIAIIFSPIFYWITMSKINNRKHNKELYKKIINGKL
ncbi:hypothetical protein [Chryseobacterium oryzae]|uniref:2TM domain-containing protein n=1 Tax=Chryseobacterium oryzae TaxID=2929799 RepID=A0ABY4BN50_9FLAO|nr:hypothetical protein [Chryseobacterium oryzae]UOE39148.1 hypothetical protein MTP08_05105 [Chryseobacterium oryzae]